MYIVLWFLSHLVFCLSLERARVARTSFHCNWLAFSGTLFPPFLNVSIDILVVAATASKATLAHLSVYVVSGYVRFTYGLTFGQSCLSVTH